MTHQVTEGMPKPIFLDRESKQLRLLLLLQIVIIRTTAILLCSAIVPEPDTTPKIDGLPLQQKHEDYNSAGVAPW